MSENYSDLTKCRSTVFKYCILSLTCSKGGTKCANKKIKTQIYAAPAVKGLKNVFDGCDLFCYRGEGRVHEER